jgi:UDP-2-acetamido-3-amino-2,3-dideoxy-glucuronate N-acetyltransferase
MTGKTPPRVCVIGAGYWGKNLVRNFHALGVLTAVCDSDADIRARTAEQYPTVRIFESLDECLRDRSFDAVSIAAPAVAHGEIARKSLAAGKHVLVEKPLCLELAEAEDIRREAEQSGLCFMVGHLLLYHPAFRAMKQEVEAGAIGPIRYIYSNRLSLGKIRRDENSLWSFAPHDISMILALVGAMPHRADTNGAAYLSPPVADTTLSHLSFSDDVQAHIFVSWLHPYKDHRIVVVGSEGMIAFDDTAAGPDKLQIFRHTAVWDGDIPVVKKSAPEPIPYDPTEPLSEECRHFLDSITSGARPTSDVDEAIRVLRVLDACQRSLTTGAPVMLAGQAAE